MKIGLDWVGTKLEAIDLDKVTNADRDQKVVHKSIFATFTQRTYATSPASLQVLFKTFNLLFKFLHT